jgi:integrase
VLPEVQPKMPKTLTAKSVEAAKPDPNVRREIPDGRLQGLYLIVQPSGSKGWAARYRHKGRTRKLTLGKYPMVSLSDAREKARAALAILDMGSDPAMEAVARRDADTVAMLVSDFMSRHASKTKSSQETRRIFDRDVLPVWGQRKAHEISRRDVIDLIDGIVDRGSPYMANRVLAAVRKLFNWATSRDRLRDSPVAGVKPPTVERPRDRTLTDDEIRWFWQATGEIGPPFGPLFRLLLITGQRREEVAAMQWNEIDGDIWSIPGGRTKNGEPQTVRLSRTAILTLSSSPKIEASDFVFTTVGKRPVSGFSRAKRRLDECMAELADDQVPTWKLHDLRRTCASGMARAGVALPVIEKCLNHVSGSFGGIVGVYQRHKFTDEMRVGWTAWDDLLRQILADAPQAPENSEGACDG